MIDYTTGSLSVFRSRGTEIMSHSISIGHVRAGHAHLCAAVSLKAGLANQASGLSNPMFIQQVTQASDRHLQYLGGSSLVAARSLKRANYVVLSSCAR